ncbi:MAG: 5-methyltetrahydropteroyltriglutamate--homocysteine methyltransferase [Methanotrichaceae archaeon]|nr:5-methyltetrahydropteroyltriglutamate--homocysteine methyltransferase [Methanotrichaceae archaeon]
MVDEGIFFDDIGSFPLPDKVKLKSLSSGQYLNLVDETLQLKISAGVEVPTYPQFRDMITMFMDPIQNPDLSESPYLIKAEHATIPELEAARPSEPLRVCVTGPVELYLSAFGATAYTDILFNLARSVARYFEKARDANKMSVASLDEPSLGISSSVVFEQEDILKALEIATLPCRNLDCEIHLHSPLYAEACCQVGPLSIIGVESAAHPDYLQLIDRKLLQDTDKFLRAGIARTDILSMVARRNEQLGVNLWEDPGRLESEILLMESPEVLAKRLARASRLFGDRLRATGPDCGLGSWPSRSLACSLLGNCSSALKAFRASVK